MKKLNYLFVAVCIFLTLTSCKKDREYTAVSNTLQEGSWRVAQFNHGEVDETDGYIGYSIKFTILETVTAAGVNFYRGNWYISIDGDLVMYFGNTFKFDRFNATWHIVNYNDQMIQMDIVGGADHLVFEKI